MLLVDPELAALSQLFLAAAMPERPPGRIQQLTLLFTATMAKLFELVGSSNQGAAGPLPTDVGTQPTPTMPAIAPQPMQPPPPPPVLFFAPGIGADLPADSPMDGGAEGGGHRAGPSSDPDAGPDAGPPSSWLPIQGFLRFDRLATTGRDLLQRLDDLCDDLGVTRLVLVACSFLAPLAAALLIQTAAALLS